MADLTISPAEQTEFAAVLSLLFQRAASEVRETTLQQAVDLLSRGVMDPAGLLAARRAGCPVGAILAIANPGAVGLVWPPQVAEAADRESIEDALLTASLTWLRQRQVKLAQALLSAVEADLGTALVRNGLRHITRLLFLTRQLNKLPTADSFPIRLEPYSSVSPDRFAAIMQRTYDGTLDCPEVEGVRTMEEILAGYRAQDGHDPALWWLISLERDPVGVLLVNSATEETAWELLYLGIVPEARGRGIGRHLVFQALTRAKAAGRDVVRLAVDRRNIPALQVYRRLGFQMWDEREVYLAVW